MFVKVLFDLNICVLIHCWMLWNGSWVMAEAHSSLGVWPFGWEHITVATTKSPQLRHGSVCSCQTMVPIFQKNQWSIVQLYLFLTIVIVLVRYLWLLLRVQERKQKSLLKSVFTKDIDFEKLPLEIRHTYVKDGFFFFISYFNLGFAVFGVVWFGFRSSLVLRIRG